MCITPFKIRTKEHDGTVCVPCGKCPQCLKRRASGWSFRLMQHEKSCFSSWFVTFTYENGSVPVSPNGFMSLERSAVQRYFKRLRKLHGCSNIVKYFIVGEYGTKTERPHYHAIIFNSKPKLIESAWSLDGKPIGQVHFGSVTGASIGYCLKYMCKPGKIPVHRNDDRVPEFAFMSKGLASVISQTPWFDGIELGSLRECMSILRGVKRLPCPGITRTESMMR